MPTPTFMPNTGIAGRNNDIKRSVKIMMDAGFEGTFALEYEDGPWDGVEGAKYLYKEVLAAL